VKCHENKFQCASKIYTPVKTKKASNINKYTPHTNTIYPRNRNTLHHLLIKKMNSAITMTLQQNDTQRLQCSLSASCPTTRNDHKVAKTV
jgi:hypothetical protein